MQLIEITKPCYRCPYCRRMYQMKHQAVAHLERCNKNPINSRKCYSCIHCEKTTATVEPDYGPVHGASVLECKKLGFYVYPPKVARSLNGPWQFESMENLPMRKKCKDWDGGLLIETPGIIEGC